jgi:hypothetical protein
MKDKGYIVSIPGTGLAIAVGPWRRTSRIAAAKTSSKKNGEIPIFPCPVWELADMELVTDVESQKLVLEEIKAREIDIVFDYEHQTLYAADNGLPAPASGWLSWKDGFRADDEALWGTPKFTSRGQGFLDADEYRYFSPVAIFEEETRRVISLHSVALTNTPRTNKQEPLTAKVAASIGASFIASGGGYGQGLKGEAMRDWLASIIYWLNLPYTTTPADAATELQKVVDLLKAEGAQAASVSASKDLPETATIAAALGFILASEAAAATTETTTVSADIAEILGVDAKATKAKVMARVLELQNPKDVVAKAEYDRVMKLLASYDGKVKADAIDRLVASNAKKLTPMLEAKIRKVAATNLQEAEDICAELQEIITDAPPAPREKQLATTRSEVVFVGDGEARQVNTDTASVAASVREILTEKGWGDDRYAEANEIRKERERASAAVE